MLPKVLSQLVEELNRLPSIGNRSAQRLALAIAKDDYTSLAQAILDLKQGLMICQYCQNYADQKTCQICLDPKRESDRLLIVSSPTDLIAIEKTNNYRGLYFVLHGLVSPLNGVTELDLRFDLLQAMIKGNQIEEVIVATNASLDGETTALYIAKALAEFSQLKVSKLAQGMPMGGDIDYTDQLTLTRAIENRQVI
ncbi:recombination protein RecR [Candidatus Nomurabacteria bacterium]|nr:recombination protein RecR [Candidatus Nomurabacteria bacterium]